jgi:hypothetical protein
MLPKLLLLYKLAQQCEKGKHASIASAADFPFTMNEIKRSFAKEAGCHPALHPVGRAGALPDFSPWSWFDPRLLLSYFRAQIMPCAAKRGEFRRLEHTKARCAVPASVLGMECRRHATLLGIQKGENAYHALAGGAIILRDRQSDCENQRLGARIGPQPSG